MDLTDGLATGNAIAFLTQGLILSSEVVVQLGDVTFALLPPPIALLIFPGNLDALTFIPKDDHLTFIDQEVGFNAP